MLHRDLGEEGGLATDLHVAAIHRHTKARVEAEICVELLAEVAFEATDGWSC